jgi:ribosome-associated translation inhibitor RaiA
LKVGKVLEKLGGDATSCHVTLKVIKNPDTEFHNSMKQDSHIGEVSVFLKGGAVVKVTDTSADMDSTVDAMVHTLSESLKKHKEKYVDKTRTKPSIGAITATPDEEE